jgi:hypothetical protein
MHMRSRYVAVSAQRFLTHGQTEEVDGGEVTAADADALAGAMGRGQEAAGMAHTGAAAPARAAHDIQADRKLELLREYFAMRS